MEAEPDRHLEALAQRQHGVFHRRQAVDAGMTRSMLRHRCHRRGWEPLPGGVYRMAGSPRTELQNAMAGVLAAGPGAVLSHSSAAALWDLPGFRLLPVHVTVARTAGRTEARSERRHTTTLLPPHHVTVLQQLPVVTPTRLLFQLAGTCSEKKVASLTDKAWGRRLVSGRSMHDMCDELSAHGRDGMTVMRAVLAGRPVGYTPPDSNLEARFQQLVADHDLPKMRRQVQLGGREWLGRVDFLAVDVPLVVFVDGERWHSSVLDRAADSRQQAELEAAGFTVVRVLEYEVWHDVPSLVEKVRAAWRQARAARTG